jgi:hypothetical protein
MGSVGGDAKYYDEEDTDEETLAGFHGCEIFMRPGIHLSSRQFPVLCRP